MARPRLVYGRRPFWWRLTLVALIAGGLLAMIDIPFAQMYGTPKGQPAHGSAASAVRAPPAADGRAAEGLADMTLYIINGMVIVAALAVAGNMIRLDRKRRREAVETFH
jgi:hypothetical protein